MTVVTGPRIDPESLPAADGLEVRGYVHDLYRHLAACDLAVVQGGLTTTMELAASGRPFIYVPLRHHFEQNFHVRHRLDRYGAGRCLDYDQTGPEALAQAIAAEIGRPVSYRPIEAARAHARPRPGPRRRPYVHFLPPAFPPRKRRQRRDQGSRLIIRPGPGRAGAGRSAGRSRAG